MTESRSDDLQQRLVDSLMRERRRDRRWSMIKTGLALLVIAMVFFTMYRGNREQRELAKESYVAVLRLSGPIMPGAHFSAKKVIPHLDEAFKDTHAQGIILVINSPGGSPVQASLIHDRIEYLKKKYKKRVAVVGRDALASGAYLVATAADDIYVNRDTLTGSIGVIMRGFGFSDAIQKLGVQRRVYTAGINKDRLDPFRPETASDQKKIKAMLAVVHQGFIDDVIQGRGDRLKGDRSALFSGDFWTGSQAVKLGLADATGNMWTVMHDQFKVEHYRDYSVKPSLLEAVFKGAETKLGFALQSHVSLQEELGN